MDHRDLTISALRERAAKLPEGWTFTLEPAPSELPAELKSLRPDAVAHGGDRSIAFEVIVGRRQASSDAKVAQVQAMRKAIESIPGWDFELIVVPEPGPSLTDEATIERQLESAQQIATESPAGAFILAFVALEWKLAQWTKVAGMEYTPLAGKMAASLVSEGLLSEVDYRKIVEYQRRRNILVHARERTFPVDDSSASEMIEFVKDLDSRITDYSGVSRG